MSAITISRQVGSLGSQIAFRLAEDLGYRLVWRELINQAARRAGVPEMALAEIDELGLLDISPSPTACRAYHQTVNELMHELADAGSVVILGRAGQVILKDRPDVLHVRVVAQPELRAARLAERTAIPVEGALAQVQASDAYRTQYLRRYYKANWSDPTLYHLVINTTWLDADQAAQIISAAFQAVSDHPAPGLLPL